ncbi:MAG: cytochrome-c peroxidase [Proteobacteria bacterium]|nr:cytochrome-c peroxidase [Pseudomonadota bacterium]
MKKTIITVITLTAAFQLSAERKVVDTQAYKQYAQIVTSNIANNIWLDYEPGMEEELNLSNMIQSTMMASQNTLDQLPEPVTDADYTPHAANKVALGKLLFFDKILSGNKNNSCSTCHHPLAWTGDGLSLPIGEGGDGIAVTRSTGYMDAGIHERVPRNAPQIFNLGAMEFDTLFHDGRVRVDASEPSGFLTPAGDDLPMGLDNVLAAQAMFPITSPTEMAGQEGENEVANAATAGDLAGENGVWNLLASRVQEIDEYVEMFKNVYADVNSASDISMVHIANSIGAFEGATWRADNSAFDKYLRGDTDAMSPNQIAGMNLFYGEANCSQCHSGKFLTSHEFKSIGMPQIGPGKGDNLPGFRDGLDDFGRERETGNSADRFKFRVPSLRNALLTGPWGHAGAYNDLRSVIKHHLNPAQGLANYDSEQAILPYRRDLSALDFAVMNDTLSRNALLSNLDIENVNLTETQIDRLLDFLDAVTDRSSIDLKTDFPLTVPSGLPVFD